MQELLVVGLIHLLAAGVASRPFWLVFTLRRRRTVSSPVRTWHAADRWFAHEA